MGSNSRLACHPTLGGDNPIGAPHQHRPQQKGSGQGSWGKTVKGVGGMFESMPIVANILLLKLFLS